MLRCDGSRFKAAAAAVASLALLWDPIGSMLLMQIGILICTLIHHVTPELL